MNLLQLGSNQMASPAPVQEINTITDQGSPSSNAPTSPANDSNQLTASVACKAKIGRKGLEKYFNDFKEYLSGEHKGKTSASCSLCKEVVWHMRHVTSNYSRHLQRKHKTDFEEWVGSTKVRNDAGTHLKQPTFQEAISASRSSTYASSHPRQLELTQMVFQNFIVELGSPFSIVEKPAFIRAMAVVDPKFSVPSRRMFTGTYLPKVYDTLIKMLRSSCSSTSFLSLSLDIWTDRRVRAYYAVTMHFVNRFGGFKSHLLAFNPLYGSCLLRL